MAGTAARRQVDEARRTAARIRAEAATVDLREVVRGILGGSERSDILSYASAIAFQVLFSLIPLALFGLGLLGFFELQEVWRADLAPQIQPHLSPPAFALVDQTAIEVLTQKRLLWITLGAAIAVWELSGAMWSVMRVSGSIYGTTERRSLWRQIAVSVALAAAVSVLVLLALAIAVFGDSLAAAAFGPGAIVVALAFVVRWALVVALLLLVVGVLVRFAPDARRPVHWVGFGSLLVVAGWVVMSLAFAWYLTWAADYSSLFGNFATAIVTLEYLFLSSIVFLTGLEVDARIRQRVEGQARS